MESNSSGFGGQGGGPSRGRYSCSKSKYYPSRSLLTSRVTSYLQGMLMLVIFTTHFPRAASERYKNLMSFETARPWNKTLYKIERGCLDFHNQSLPTQFYNWPEDSHCFDYCCSDFVTENIQFLNISQGQPLVDNFTYGRTGPQLQYVIYYDLGLIDQCLPYWKCTDLYQKLYKYVQRNTQCERTDLQRLYCHRYWAGIVVKYGLLQSALPFIVSLELVVMLSIAVYCRWLQISRTKLEDARKTWCRMIFNTVLIDCTHLCLLAIIGNGLIEAMGHRNPYDSASKAFYNYSKLYIALSFLVAFSSFLHQLSYWIAVCKPHVLLPVPVPSPGRRLIEVDLSKQDRETSQQSHLSRSTRHEIKELEKEIGLNSDWKLQPIAAQLAIVFCLWTYLTYIEIGELMTGGVFGLIVAAAGPWSGLYASKVIVHAFPYVFKLKLIKCSIDKVRLGIDGFLLSIYTTLIRSIQQWMKGTQVSEPAESGPPLKPSSTLKRASVDRLALPPKGPPSPTVLTAAARSRSPAPPSTLSKQ